MQNARDIRRRIKSVKSTQQITKAMKMVSAAKMRRAQEAVQAARPYAIKFTDVLGRVSAAAGSAVSHPLLEVREPKKTAYIIITADRGLCGGFNANVIRRAAKELAEYDEPALITVGRKGRDFFRRREANIAAEFVNLGENISFKQAKEIAQFVIDKYTAGEFDQVFLVYSEFINTLTQRPTTVKLLPIETPAEGEEKNEEGAKKPKVSYMYEPNAESVLGELLPKYVETSIFRALLEAKAGEHGARMTAMDSATNNAKEMIRKLTLSLNRARQAAITKEISEIVGGAEALG
ncbi:MAG: F0F1 ATP synthase subunit gamma [Desulfotomaculum sp.]|nr:F0F1 ATP synthase subunit gamma [Desulfotomaculum sp.]